MNICKERMLVRELVSAPLCSNIYSPERLTTQILWLKVPAASRSMASGTSDLNTWVAGHCGQLRAGTQGRLLHQNLACSDTVNARGAEHTGRDRSGLVVE